MGLVKSAAYSVHTTKSKIMKAIIRIITIVLALLYWTSSSLAEDMSEIVSKHVAALGKHANRLHSIQIEQKLLSNGVESIQTTILVPKHFFYQQMILQGGQVLTYVRDSLGWSLNSFVSSKVRMMSPQECATFLLLNTQMLGPIYEYGTDSINGPVQTITLEGDDKIEEEPCHRMKVVYKGGIGETDVYISKKSYLIKMTVNVLGKTFFSNYRSVHGIVFPHRIEIINAYGKAVGDVLSIKQNPSIDFERLKITP